MVVFKSRIPSRNTGGEDDGADANIELDIFADLNRGGLTIRERAARQAATHYKGLNNTCHASLGCIKSNMY